MKKLFDLKYAIENESFITSPLLPTDRFISYCVDRGIQTSREQLEKFEKLGIFFPFARVRYPKIKVKIEYIDDGKRYRDLGVLRDDENWAGDIKEEYSDFYFTKQYAQGWLEEGFLWEPTSRPFQAWETFRGDSFRMQIESYYSIFQCYPLYHLLTWMTLEVGVEDWLLNDQKEINELRKFIEWKAPMISSIQEHGIRGESADIICQIISNRYFPETVSDRRSIRLSIPTEYHGWDWYGYCRSWDARAVLANIEVVSDVIKSLYDLVALDAQVIDPLARWYDLVTFISVEQKQQLKDKALLAQTLYAMAQMLSQFYKDLTGQELPAPNETLGGWKERFYGEGVTQNELLFLIPLQISKLDYCTCHGA